MTPTNPSAARWELRDNVNILQDVFKVSRIGPEALQPNIQLQVSLNICARVSVCHTNLMTGSSIQYSGYYTAMTLSSVQVQAMAKAGLSSVGMVGGKGKLVMVLSPLKALERDQVC